MKSLRKGEGDYDGEGFMVRFLAWSRRQEWWMVKVMMKEIMNLRGPQHAHFLLT